MRNPESSNRFRHDHVEYQIPSLAQIFPAHTLSPATVFSYPTSFLALRLVQVIVLPPVRTCLKTLRRLGAGVKKFYEFQKPGYLDENQLKLDVPQRIVTLCKNTISLNGWPVLRIQNIFLLELAYDK